MKDSEINALVAEKVCGWTEIHSGPGCDCCVDTWTEWRGSPPLKKGDSGQRFQQHPACSQCGHRPDKWREVQITAERPTVIPEYATSIDAVFRDVVPVMQVKGWWMELHSPFGAVDPWFAGFTPLNTTGWNGRPDHEASDPDSPARAICLAALRALGEEVG